MIEESQEPQEQEDGTSVATLHEVPPPPVTSLVAVPPPPMPFSELPADRVEFYVRSAMHQDRTPGRVLVVAHPGKRHKIPRGLFEALEARGFALHQLDTDADRVTSVERIADALRRLVADPGPLDILVVSGDGSLDHHVLVAAYSAFYPELVRHRPGSIDCSRVDEADLAALPADYREELFRTLPARDCLDPSEANIKQIWLARLAFERALLHRAPARRLARKARRELDDPVLRLAVLSALLPDRVTLRPHGFDLTQLATASLESSFQGLYPFVRCICTYPAGTAADNAVFAGVPGWGYSMLAGLLTRFSVLDPLRRALERRVVDAFVHYFTADGVVVPARLSVVAFDGDWQRVSSHAAGGPGAGRFFTADLVSKTKGMLGYLKRIPAAIVLEGIFGSTVVRIRSRLASGAEKSFTEAQMAEGLYTNRTFIAGVGSVPTTDPTAFAGQSSLVVIPPIWSRDSRGHRIINLRGIGGFTEGIVKGTLARLLHVSGLGVGTLAGGGRFLLLQPEHQVAIKEGESIEIEYLHLDRSPRAVTIQVSGDPFQAQRMSIRVLWGPVPLLARGDSLLLTATRRSLANVHLQQSFSLRGVYIGGVYHFHHHVGDDWSPEFVAGSGLLRPHLHLPRHLPQAQRVLSEAWQRAGAGEFVDTTESGLALWRRGRFAHNNDQTAHLILLREPHGGLLVRLVRATGSAPREIYELRAWYRRGGGAFIIHRSQTIRWQPGQPPQIAQEDYYFRSAETFQQEAPSFFPVVATSPEQPTLLDADASDLDGGSDRGPGARPASVGTRPPPR